MMWQELPRCAGCITFILWYWCYSFLSNLWSCHGHGHCQLCLVPGPRPTLIQSLIFMQSWAKTLRQNIFIIAHSVHAFFASLKSFVWSWPSFVFFVPKKASMEIIEVKNLKKNLKISPVVLEDDRRGNKTQGPGHNHNNQSTTCHNADLSKPSSAHYQGQHPESGRQCTRIILIASYSKDT